MRYVLAMLFVLPLLIGEAAGQHYLMKNSQNGEETCSQFQDRAQSYLDGLHYREGYDSLRAYIEKCPFDILAPASFSLVSSSAKGILSEGEVNIWDSCRGWLKKVLYLNPDSAYFCADLAEYAFSYAYGSDLGPVEPSSDKYKTTLAILSYLADSSHCGYFKSYLYSTTSHPNSVWNTYHKHWQDTVKDSVKTPFDSTLPSLDSIGMGWLRGFQRAVKSGEFTTYRDALGELTATKNPFSDEIELHVTPAKPVVAKLEVYDALGRMLWDEPEGYLDPREHLVKINASSWSSGTYYARITTLQGEVKTCKLVKE